MKTVLITGATGYVGKHLTKAYLDQGFKVVACGRTKESLDELADSYKGRDLVIHPLDVTDSAATYEAVHIHQPDVIIHAAAYPRRKAADQSGGEVPLEQTPLYKLNVGGMSNIAQAAVDAGRPVHLSIISSGAAFDQTLEHVNADSPRDMSNPFAVTKNLGEQAVERIVAGSAHVKTSILYPPVVLDETQTKGIIPFSAARALRGEALENNAYPGAGMNMMVAEDLGRAVLAVTEKQSESFVHYPINGTRIPTVNLLQKVAGQVAKITGNTVPVKEGNGSLRGMPKADETAILNLLGKDFSWQPLDAMMEAIVSTQPIPTPKKPEPLDLLAAIRAAYPDITPAQLKASVTSQAFLDEAYGKMPGYSTLSGPQLQNVKTTTVGAFSISYGYDTSAKSHANRGQGEPVVAIIKRGDKGPAGEDRFGVLGGYMDLGSETRAGEQPKEGTVREIREEALNDKGEPVISPQPDRLKLLVSGVDYRNVKLPVTYIGHALELNVQELAALKLHADRLKTDDAYRSEVVKQSHGEVSDLQIVPLSQVLAMPRDSFTHPHEYDAFSQLAEMLKQQQNSVVR